MTSRVKDPAVGQNLLEDKDKDGEMKLSKDGWLFNIKSYTAIASSQLFSMMVMFSYGIGALRTMEKKFRLSSADLSYIMSFNDIITTVMVIVLGFIGGKIHKPRFMASAMLLVFIGNFMYIMLYFANPVYSGTPKKVTVGNGTSPWLTGPRLNVCTQNSTDQSCSLEDQQKQSADSVAYYVLMIGSIFTGVGSSTNILSLVYIDENVKKDDSALYIGILTSMYAWGPIFGFSLASLCTRLPEDLTGYLAGRVEIGNPMDPNYIGCWWLGYVVVAVLLTLTIIPMFFFPKHFKYYYWVKSLKATDVKEDREKTLKEKLKEFPKLFCRLMSNVPYLVTLVSTILAMYFIVALIINMPRYIEIHFQMPAYKANMLAALGSALASAVGNIVGGILMKKLKIRPLGAAWMFVVALVISAAGTVALMLLKCPQPDMTGTQGTSGNSLDLVMPCNAECSCKQTELIPLCHGEKTYFSPCHAGCSTYHNGTYSDCSCLDPTIVEPPLPGMCGTTCQMLIPYIVVFFAMSFLGSMGRVPITILKLRVVGDELKTLALGVASAAINVLTFVPGMILFGNLIDSTCLVWNTSCGQEGNCLFYNIVSLRFLLHGASLAFQLGSLIFAVILLILIYRKQDFYNSLYEDHEEKRSPIVKDVPLREKLMSDENRNTSV